ncbi:hypothetical protein [Streptomyces sp. NPDC059122]|uniref:hypothetical protein n=1 Tax=Streptomyces sp. NPDC059122 TaxID=3346732 RepID=UPI003695EF5D
MKVRFTGLEGHEQSVRQGAGVLRQGQVYVVLEVYCQSEGPNYFRIEYRRGEIPPLFDSRLFEIVDSEIHPSWTISTEWDGSLTIAPAAWHKDGFWDEFMNHSPEAVDVYELDRRILMPEP